MSDYAKKTDTKAEMDSDFRKRIKEAGGIDALRLGDVEKFIREVKGEWDTRGVIRSLLEELDTIAGYYVNPYPVGEAFANLNADNLLIVRDGLLTVGGEASTGKSSFISALALDVMARDGGTCFLLYTLDDSMKIAGKRILSQLVRKNLFYHLPDPGRIRNDEDGRSLAGRVFMKENLVPAFIVSDAEKVKDLANCPRVIIGIDYLQKIRNTGNMDTRIFLNNAVDAIKDAEKELEPGCLVLLASQLNRDADSKGHRYRETSEIENVSDVCLDLSIPPDLPLMPSRHLRISKNKLGEKGAVFSCVLDVAGGFIFRVGERIETDFNTTGDFAKQGKGKKKRKLGGLINEG
jgi:hypothetical protein